MCACDANALDAPLVHQRPHCPEAMGCLFSKKAGDGIDSNRLTFDGVMSDGATGTENFSGGMDDLFADLASSMVTQIKSGPLKKLGGKSKDKWETRMFELTNTGLTWSASKDTQQIVPADIIRVETIANVQDKPAFKVRAATLEAVRALCVAPICVLALMAVAFCVR